MKNNTLTVDYIERLKSDFEDGKIKEKDITKDEAILMSVLYEIQLMELEEEIEKTQDEVENYKTRLKRAIKYLKNKKK